MTARVSAAEAVPADGFLADAFTLTFLSPSPWIVALAGFLARGGIVLIVAPIVVVPSLSGIVTGVGPLVTRLVLGRPGPELVAAGAALLVLGGVVTLGLLLLGGAIDGWLIGVAAADLDIRVSPAANPTAARLAAARILAYLPLVVALVLAIGPIVGSAYREVTVPGDLGTPVALRVIARDPVPVVLLIVVAIACDALAAAAVRGIALDGSSVVRSVPGGLRSLARRPLAALVAAVGSIVVTVVLVVPALVASGVAFGGVGALATAGDGGAWTVVATLLLVTTFLGGLLLAGIAGAWRSFVWTAFYARAREPGPSRDWYPGRRSGTLPPEVTG